jgi:hypothetical protein
LIRSLWLARTAAGLYRPSLERPFALASLRVGGCYDRQARPIHFHHQRHTSPKARGQSKITYGSVYRKRGISESAAKLQGKRPPSRKISSFHHTHLPSTAPPHPPRGMAYAAGAYEWSIHDSGYGYPSRDQSKVSIDVRRSGSPHLVR